MRNIGRLSIQTQEGRKHMTDWIKPFPITSVYRSDLLHVSLTQEQAATLTDVDMLKIANKMALMYLGSKTFWNHLLTAVEQVMLEKEH
jgi:hypothetical protein